MKRLFVSIRLLLIVFDSVVIIVAYDVERMDEPKKMLYRITVRGREVETDEGEKRWIRSRAALRIVDFLEYHRRHTWTNFCWLWEFIAGFWWRIDETNRCSMRRNQSILMSIQVVILNFATHQILFTRSIVHLFFFLFLFLSPHSALLSSFLIRFTSVLCWLVCNIPLERYSLHVSHFLFYLHFNDEIYNLLGLDPFH